MVENGVIYFARKGDENGLTDKLLFDPAMANRHGFICGATGTGKTVTLKVMAESFSALGVPVFISDVKGDVAGISQPGADSESMQERIKRFGLEDSFRYQGYPVSIYDIYGEKGVPLRTTISEMGPMLLSQILELNDTQTALLTVIFKIADDNELIMHDTKDLKAVLQYVIENADSFESEYGHIAEASVTTVIRGIVALEAEGADVFFGDPAIDIKDMLVRDAEGRGVVNILDSQSLINKPRMYSAFMLYLLSEIFETLPEIGDPEKPELVFFFDEAHILFDKASSALLEKLEQMVKLIRSKGVGVFLITQNPADIPEGVMSQLGNKIEHALRAYTPSEQKALKAAADSFRTNESFDTTELLQNLGKGEAIVSMLDAKGVPGISEHAYILPPESRMDAITDEERAALVQNSPVYAKYATTVDPETAYEKLKGNGGGSNADNENENGSGNNDAGSNGVDADKNSGNKAKTAVTKHESKGTVYAKPQKMSKEMKSTLRTASGSVGREAGKALGEALLGKKGKTIGGNIGASLGRNLFGTLTKGK